MSATQADAVQSASREGDFHPSYSSEDATLVLESRDGVKFRAQPIMLQMASEIFRNMLAQAKDNGEPVPLQEQSHTVKSLLDFIYPDAPYFDLEVEGFHSIWNLLRAAEKYDIEKILSEFRKRMSTDSYFSKNPIQSYVIANRFGWKKEASECALAAIDQLQRHRDYSYLVHIDARSIMKLYRFADIYRKVISEEVVQVMFFTRNATLTEGEAWDEETSNSQYIVEAFAARSLFDCPSGKHLLEDLRKPFLRKYLFDDWEAAYQEAWQRADFYGSFPKDVDKVVLDPDEILLDI